MAKEIKKSTRLVTTVLAGMINLGKYTLVIRLALLIRLLLLSERELAKNCQGNRAAYTMIAYGALPSVGNLAKLPKITVKTIMVRTGRINAQAIPDSARYPASNSGLLARLLKSDKNYVSLLS